MTRALVHRPSRSYATRALRRAQGALAGTLLLLATLLALLAAVPARAAEPELTSFGVTREEDGVYLHYAVEFELSKSVEDALAKGVPLFFVAEADVLRDRWYWSDHRVSQATRTWRIVYQPLTSSYRVTYGGLSQTYASRTEALAAVSRSARWKIADANQVGDGGGHYVEFSYRLDTSLMPRPMQIGIGGQPDWTLVVKRTQRF
ncbi:DUF4390 domain-containing protein [Piscinibacter koreensis]|uniref:DUF4390 domain-containing protein n=1 Tax=Piscinibacter koreensis TaxID=2742824 RepID=A0A7Y6NKD5_9BURK|nr:DUF4390 domain-containing protein [Schlegelella koreensis]NUZ04755.1 DUF4390 domain-containing protein [Schlegelella koreensis]